MTTKCLENLLSKNEMAEIAKEAQKARESIERIERKVGNPVPRETMHKV